MTDFWVEADIEALALVGLKAAPASAVILRTKDYPAKITFGEMRETGATRIIVFCKDYRCSHNVQMDASRWPDEVRISDVEPRFVCTVCSKRGSNIRSADEPPRMGTSG